jgi:hypothetical protein
MLTAELRRSSSSAAVPGELGEAGGAEGERRRDLRRELRVEAATWSLRAELDACAASRDDL